jgi:hypothetical protein
MFLPLSFVHRQAVLDQPPTVWTTAGDYRSRP